MELKSMRGSIFILVAAIIIIAFPTRVRHPHVRESYGSTRLVLPFWKGAVGSVKRTVDLYSTKAAPSSEAAVSLYLAGSLDRSEWINSFSMRHTG
jgi:hypothetical protein